MIQKKGWKSYVVQALAIWACEYRVGGYYIGSAIFGLDSFSFLAPYHIDYSKVDPGLSDRAYSKCT